jgi:hypothetical protein
LRVPTLGMGRDGDAEGLGVEDSTRNDLDEIEL